MSSILITSFSLFLLGAIVGSFVNVVGLRWGSKSIFSGRSYCFSCSKQLRWWELVPIVSFFALGARCRSCKSRLSWQYPAIEILTGLVFASVFNHQLSIYREFSWAFALSTLLYLAVFSIYIVIFIYDLKHRIISDGLVYASIILALGLPAFLIHYSLVDLLAGPVLFSFFAFIWLISRGRAMGFGDAKLALSIGILLGAEKAFSAVVLAFWIGTLTVLVWMLLGRKKLTMKSEIPFGPFLIIGAWLSLVFNLNLLYVSTFF